MKTNRNVKADHYYCVVLSCLSYNCRLELDRSMFVDHKSLEFPSLTSIVRKQPDRRCEIESENVSSSCYTYNSVKHHFSRHFSLDIDSNALADLILWIRPHCFIRDSSCPKQCWQWQCASSGHPIRFALFSQNSIGDCDKCKCLIPGHSDIRLV